MEERDGGGGGEGSEKEGGVTGGGSNALLPVEEKVPAQAAAAGRAAATDAPLDMTTAAQSYTSNNQGRNDGSNENDTNDGQDQEAYDIESDPEVILLTKFRLALGSTLLMLECARDDLVRLGDRMDRLTEASKSCRTRLAEQQQIQGEFSDEKTASTQDVSQEGKNGT